MPFGIGNANKLLWLLMLLLLSNRNFQFFWSMLDNHDFDLSNERQNFDCTLVVKGIKPFLTPAKC